MILDRRNALKVFVVLFVAAGLHACATKAVLRTSWEMPGYRAKPFKHFAVLAVMKNELESDGFESAVVGHFAKEGVLATPGFALFDRKKKWDSEEMQGVIAQQGIDAVLEFKTIGIDERSYYVPPATYILPQPGPWGFYDPYYHYYSPWWGYYDYWNTAVQVTSTPGYWRESKTYRVEVVLYQVKDDKLIWSAVTSTVDPDDAVDLAKAISRTVLKELGEKNLVQR
jgi:hypothetical protein